MKLKSLFVIGFIALAGNTAFAQDFSDAKYAKYGDTPEARKENVMKYNYLRDAYNLKQYDLASKYFNELLATAPAVSQNLYIMGSTIYKNKIATSKTAEDRNRYVDSLLVIYDIRNEHFGSHATRGTDYIHNEKAKDAIAYIPENLKVLDKLVDTAIESNKDKSQDIALLHGYFNLLVEGYKIDKVETEFLLSEYDQLSSTLDKSTDPEAVEAKSVLDQLFIQSGAANCDNLEKIYKPQYEADPTNKDLILKIARYLTRQECNSDFRRLISEEYYKIEPSAAAAISLATSAQQNKNYEVAFKYYDEAINLEENTATKSNFALSAAGTALIAGNARLAADYAKKSISIDENNNGLGYFILAQAQAQGLSACSGFDKQAGFWIVVDNLLKAKALLQDNPEQLTNVNNAINSYSAGFPSAEEVFFRTLTPGSSYNVNCGWVSGTTTIREKR